MGPGAATGFELSKGRAQPLGILDYLKGAGAATRVSNMNFGRFRLCFKSPENIPPAAGEMSEVHGLAPALPRGLTENLWGMSTICVDDCLLAAVFPKNSLCSNSWKNGWNNRLLADRDIPTKEPQSKCPLRQMQDLPRTSSEPAAANKECSRGFC